MINIFSLPTENQTKLYRNLLTDKLFILENSVMDVSECNREYRHIYITNNDKIKGGDWYLVKNRVLKCVGPVPHMLSPKQIILTTDLLLNGVQRIPMDFLEWFVYNPKAEYVDVEFKPVCCGECDERLCYVDVGEQDPEYVINFPKRKDEVREPIPTAEEFLLQEGMHMLHILNGVYSLDGREGSQGERIIKAMINFTKKHLQESRKNFGYSESDIK